MWHEFAFMQKNELSCVFGCGECRGACWYNIVTEKNLGIVDNDGDDEAKDKLVLWLIFTGHRCYIGLVLHFTMHNSTQWQQQTYIHQLILN